MPKSYLKFPRAGAPIVPWRVDNLCRAYHWPSGLAGGGVIGIGELGGGWLQSDLEQFCQLIGMPVPTVTDVSLDGTVNNQDPNDPASGEVTLDVQVAAASYWVATGKPANIRVYFAANAEDSIPNVTTRAAADSCDTLSWSWGSDEANTGKAGCEAMESASAAAISKGTVIFAAAGDNDSSDGGPNPANVDNPASCPHVVGCGGTMKTASEEIVWNDEPGDAHGEGTGGGFSRFFPAPTWTSGARHGTRMVPDVAGNAEPRTGYLIVLGGQVMAIGGTSAVSPLYAGLFAAFGRKLGFVAPTLWSNHLAFTDITVGNNGRYRAMAGPDPCTGLGSPVGTALAKLFVK